MKNVTILATLVLACSALAAKGQISGGPKIGINFPAHYVKESGSKVTAKNRYLVGFHVGGELLVQLPVAGLEFQIDALFTRKGFRYSEVMPTIIETVEPDITENMAERTTKITQELYYLEFPVRINYSIGLSSTGLFAGLGPTIGVGLFGKTRTDGQKPVVIGWGEDSNEYKRYDLGLGAQLGIRLMGTQLSGYFDWCFVNISNRSSVVRNNYNGGISLAYLF